MLKSKQLPAQYGLTVFPAFVILVIALMAILRGTEAGIHPRESLFDLYQRVDARDTTPAEDRPALVMIDKESIAEIGPWPWPRTALADLVEKTKAAGAKNVIVTVPVAGPDPLSPEVVGQYWFSREGSAAKQVATAVQSLPSHDAALATALAEWPGAVTIANLPTTTFNDPINWREIETKSASWLTLQASEGTSLDSERISLPRVSSAGAVSPLIQEQATPSVSSLPLDRDGIVRRMPMVWTAYDSALPSTALTVPLVNGTQPIIIPEPGRIKASGYPIQEILLGDEQVKIDINGSVPLYFPKETALTTVSAWRLLESGESWAQPLEGKTVFIGESVSREAYVTTARGAMTVTHVQALMGEDLITPGKQILRPGWAPYMEAGLALLFGVGAVLAGLFLGATIATGVTIALGVFLMATSFFTFSGSGLMVDPLPPILAMVLGQLAIVAAMVTSMLWRDDAVRGSFHGALPAATMTRLQRNRKSKLLDGVRRQVTVLSVNIRLPKEALATFAAKPQDYIHFLSHTNDRMRKAILAHGGTVDFAEDGRLLGYWNVPEEQDNHIERAATCALQMIDNMSLLTQDLQSAAFARTARIIEDSPAAAFEQGSIEIGIASDVAYCGPVGKGARNRYSVIGSVVRFAGQLRRRSPSYGPAIICDEAVFKALRHQYAMLDLDILRVEDEGQVRPIYGLVGNPFFKASKPFRELSDVQRDFVHAWRDGELDKAEKALSTLKSQQGKHEAYVSLMESRLEKAKLATAGKDGKKMLMAEVVSL